ncbi:S-adenosyl-L-methionine-dependent methyltransferase [Basidiobolus meristosporus CBS 931.73]|uniref:S-adenosyl-L-methionine-dependent methyltransferase n=1 Tax=Basidiobolus meristosporus CBS 931.73 TaxID=1314790 RepID=A0A1Y1Y3A8_9FUNG|nr:S-adenosyl-L-methionine-dependent methyltransferase [Basidiobolus meristosporus CBS 931.73]|eukprot:ORX92512.1 S-adenosyl-L-methionine-dependent methyltransferase [Basidiobolus meristosporus CBS 931.73]
MSSSEKTPLFIDYDTQATLYERLTGGCTRDVASEMIALSEPVDNSSKVLDNACGTGILTLELLEAYPTLCDGATNPIIHSVDISKPMTSLLQARVAARKCSAVEIGVMDAQKLDFEEDTFTHSFTNFGIFLFPDPLKGAQEIHRTLKKGGTAVVSTWKYYGYLPILHGIQKAICPSEQLFEVPVSKEWQKPETLRELLQKVGFQDVEVHEKQARSKAKDIHALASTLKDGFYKTLTKSWTAGQAERWDEVMLNVLKQSCVVQYESDGTVALPMIAWVAVATK